MDSFETVPFEQYEAILKLLEEERIKHAETKQKLMDTEDKLEYANGEIEILQKQIQREKKQFDQAFQVLKDKALKESSKNVELENKCYQFEQDTENKKEDLSEKQSKIENLTHKLQTQQAEYQREVEEMNIQLQQEAYISRVLGEKANHTGRRDLPKYSATRTSRALDKDSKHLIGSKPTARQDTCKLRKDVSMISKTTPRP